MNKIKYQALKAELDKMTEKQLRARARSLMRTANRRIQSYRDYGKEGLKNLSLEAIKENLQSAKMYNEDTGKITMKGLDARGLKTLIIYQEELKEVETVNKYKKEVLKSYKTNKNKREGFFYEKKRTVRYYISNFGCDYCSFINSSRCQH